ncbi:hypothetical protein IRJ41_020676, partial [Triplophysa rosa]
SRGVPQVCSEEFDLGQTPNPAFLFRNSSARGCRGGKPTVMLASVSYLLWPYLDNDRPSIHISSSCRGPSPLICLRGSVPLDAARLKRHT